MARSERKTQRRIVAGVDTHVDTHHAAVMLMSGRRLADAEFPATERGYRSLLSWLRSWSTRLVAVGVEGTGSYGAGVARFLAGEQVRVVEVARPDRRQRRNEGKSDPLDAYAAAEAVLADRARAVPKAGAGLVEAVRMVHASRRGAVKARTAAVNELRGLLVTAPSGVRESVPATTGPALVAAIMRLDPATCADPVEQACVRSLRCLAGRYQQLTDEITEHDTRLQELVRVVCPRLLDIHGVGTETAAQILVTAGDNPDRIPSPAAFAKLCGTAPIPASSGRTHRHRLSRGGDRQANRALHTIMLTRLATHPETRTYRDRRTQEGLSPRDIQRCLKTYLARHIHKTLMTCMNTQPQPLDTP